jgi:hypothetical protein
VSVGASVAHWFEPRFEYFRARAIQLSVEFVAGVERGGIVGFSLRPLPRKRQGDSVRKIPNPFFPHRPLHPDSEAREEGTDAERSGANQ